MILACVTNCCSFVVLFVCLYRCSVSADDLTVVLSRFGINGWVGGILDRLEMSFRCCISF